MTIANPASRQPSAQRVLISLALCAVGCSNRDVHDAGEPLRSTVRVALGFTRVGNDENLRFEGQGHFARYGAAEADRVPALLGIPDDDSIVLDTCRVVDSALELDRALAAARAPIDVRLLDAGRIAARGPEGSTTLVPRHYPELTPYVAGVVYGNEDAAPLALMPGAIYEVTGEGGEEIGPFVAQVQAPRAFPGLDVPYFRRGADLDVRWTEPGEASGAAMLSVAWSARGSSREVRCRVRDDGSFTVPRELLASMPAPSQLASAEVVMVRARKTAILAPGVSPGELVLGLRQVVPLALAGLPVPTVALPSAAAENDR